MILLKIIVLFLLHLALFFGLKAEVTEYKVIQDYKTLTNGRSVLVFREFKKNGEQLFLATDVDTFETSIVKPEELQNFMNFKFSRFQHFLLEEKPIKSLSSKQGYLLTVDLCSKPKTKGRKFEDELFEYLVELSSKTHKPTPVFIAITGIWIEKEPENFTKLQALKKQGKLEIIWVNHSFSHPVNNNKFLTKRGLEFEQEVLRLEKLLLEKGEVPSAFFRFPGLTFNKELLSKLRELSLIALDANAWLAKGENPISGSIILVHGNGNEHKGIEIFFKRFKNKNPKFLTLKEFSHGI